MKPEVFFFPAPPPSLLNHQSPIMYQVPEYEYEYEWGMASGLCVSGQRRCFLSRVWRPPPPHTPSTRYDVLIQGGGIPVVLNYV